MHNLKSEVSELSELVGALATIELNLQNEMNQHATRLIHLREGLRHMREISVKLSEMIVRIEQFIDESKK